ncbi:MAG TPA: histidine kinase [Cyclobacteriaceae bacterium]|nr:histidine kinase [Cyclobacteriaceae bacterium]
MLRASLLIVLGLLAMPVSAQNNVLTLDGQPQWETSFDMADYTLFARDLSNSLTISQTSQLSLLPFHRKENERKKMLERSKVTTWLTFTIRNTSADTIHLLFSCQAHEYIDLYRATTLIGQSGLSRGVAYRGPIEFDVLPKADNLYWVRVVDLLQSVEPITSTLDTRGSYYFSLTNEVWRLIPLLLVFAIAMGCFLFMGTYSAHNFYLHRDKGFLYYSICSFLLFYYTLFAMSNRFGLSDALNGVGLFGYVFVVYGLFVSEMIGLQKMRPRAWKFLKVLLVMCAAVETYFIVEELFVGHPLIPWAEFYAYGLALPIAVVVSCFVFVLQSKSPIRKYLLVGMSGMILVGMIPSFFNMHITMPFNAWEAIINLPPAIGCIGFVFENICFSMALSYKHKLSEDEKKTFERRLVDMELTALRAQMNPHFIFNCLNSIKLYTLERNPLTAADYLTKFSRLIRLVLENSQSGKISLAAELEMLQLYVDMEIMRFKDKFDYEVFNSGNVDLGYVEIPPLIIQPYVENAIWHGLMHKDGPGKVTVDINQGDPNNLFIRVTDNGVGRKRATELKSKSATRHKSFGMKVNSERIELLNQLENHDRAVRIKDLFDDFGAPIGTEVTITIPVSS